MTILGVDIGTTAMKMGVFRAEGEFLSLIRQFTRHYAVNTYNDGLFSDIEPEKWRQAFLEGCREMEGLMGEIDAISLSGTTPGFTAMDSEGEAVYPAILMLDQRSRVQAQRIIKTVGLPKLLETSANMPVAGGCSLASLLWIRDNHPELYARARMFGHSNTYLARWLTGKAAIDPSSASLMALYNTVLNDLTWNAGIAAEFDVPLDFLPEVKYSHESAGSLKKEIAALTGLRREPPVVIGGNDAVLAAYCAGIREAGDIMNVNGTCEITLVCLPRCLPSIQYNIRAHVLPGMWLTLYVMNAGGKALEWFRNLFCREMAAEEFYGDFLTGAIDAWIDRESGVTYVPFLMGSRYSQQPLKAEFLGMTHETSREELLAALIRGLCQYQREHLKDVGLDTPLSGAIHVTGGAVNEAVIRAKTRWMRNCAYVIEEESSMKGAAMLGRKYLEK
ncbi:MAG: FGGY family carbohydrate kinase [Candidatus Latescibacter sp.]|nr:FGGY family carbohydrate kinase [Candidatus Latescibacter sp.]